MMMNENELHDTSIRLRRERQSTLVCDDIVSYGTYV